MPLSLADPRWNELQGSYGGTEDIVAWLTEAQEADLSEERLGDLVNEVQHQGDTSTAMYAVAVHLIALAHKAAPKAALTLLAHAGFIYGASSHPQAVPCPEFLQDECTISASEGAHMLASLLPTAEGFDAFKWAVAGLAGFMGHHGFARLLDGLDFHEGQFHHALLDKPFPLDD